MGFFSGAGEDLKSIALASGHYTVPAPLDPARNWGDPSRLPNFGFWIFFSRRRLCSRGQWSAGAPGCSALLWIRVDEFSLGWFLFGE